MMRPALSMLLLAFFMPSLDALHRPARPAMLRLRGGELDAIDVSHAAFQVQKGLAPTKTPAETYFALAEKGAVNAKTPLAKLLHQAFMGGCYVAIGGVFALTVAGALAHLGPDVQRFIIALIFPIGLVFILQAAGQLMTGNFAVVTAALLEGEVDLIQALRSFGLTCLGNAVGCGFISLAIQQAGLLKGGTAELAAALATKKCAAPLGQTLIKAILCNWLVSLAIFLASQSAALPGKVLGIWSCIPMFVSIGLEHSVANMFFIPFGMLAGADVTVMQMLTKNLIIVTLGNLIGGGVLLAGGMSYQFGALGATPVEAKLQDSEEPEV
jgi:formate/nitrite transporter